MHFQPIENSFEDAYVSHLGGGPRVELHASLDQLDDVFGSTPASPAEPEAQTSSHPSDIRRLETEHTNAGYREGITVAKEASIQGGFDEGFSLGATIGLRAGQLLGMVEGIADAVKGRPGEAAETAEKLLNEARDELSTGKIFSAEYWAPDGTWNYDVTAQDGDQILFPDVAAAHPLIQKWSRVVDEQTNMWHIQVSILDDDANGPRLDTAAVEPPLNVSAPTRSKQSLDW
ncbi:essential protein Yae1 [Metarhizium robertsii]|uniref:Protein YAE1 n=2 Tax=Metarhizium robertsii TaxID=568076 RepID=E9EUV7_METRA|nr:ABC1 domain containing protein [Metarhizium robertsii ARSEF 23]EFZ01210.1 ABC1 domain containing protein [Metarhizium robertsii ARSEF 23]EXV03781.1 essential protein Yae1 [Metarhizium robertsii]